MSTASQHRMLIDHVRLVLPGDKIVPGCLAVEGGKIVKRYPTRSEAKDAGTVVDGKGRLLTPGLVDLHTHGIERFLYEQGAEDLLAGAARLGAYGATTFLPTVVPKKSAASLGLLSRLADAIPGVRGVCVPGLHLEGPFTAVAGAACELLPGDLGFLDELLAACRNRVAVMSVSPDTANILPVIERLVERGITVFMTHTRASVKQTQAAIEAGARHATHFYDVFPMPPEIDPGVRPAGAVEAIMADPRVTVDVIADGCHVDPVVPRMVLQAKGWKGLIAITDSNIGAGLPTGEYPTPWGYPVRVEAGNGARIADRNSPHYGGLAGSALTMNVAISNLSQWLNLPPAQVWAMGTLNPARRIGLTTKGMLDVGADADLVLWNEDMTPAITWVGGTVVFEQQEKT